MAAPEGARCWPPCCWFRHCFAGCTSLEPGPGRGLLDPPLRAIGLARHHAELALGRYSRNAGPAADCEVRCRGQCAPRLQRRPAGGDMASATPLPSSISAGDCILTDPVLEPNRSLASPLPRRLVEIPFGVEDLPQIDAIMSFPWRL